MIAERTVDAIVEAFRSAAARHASTTARPTAATCSPTSSTTTNRTRSWTPTCACSRRATRDGRTFATLLNFSAHTTVLGAGNTKVSGDWVQAANPLLEERFGGEAVTMVGTLGRTQPADRGCSDPAAREGEQRDLCAHPRLRGRGSSTGPSRPRRRPSRSAARRGVEARSYLIEDPATNALLLGPEPGRRPAGRRSTARSPRRG